MRNMASRPSAAKQIVAAAEILTPDQIKSEVWRLTSLTLELSNPDDCLRWLARRRLISNSVNCCICGKPSSLVGYQQAHEGKRWSCNKCNFRQSVRHGSFFAHSHLAFSQVMKIIYCWTMDMPQNLIAHECATHSNTVTDWCNFCREECENYLLRQPCEIGGMDENGCPIVVEIDRSKYFHQKRNGGQQSSDLWVLGGVERESGRCFLVEMEDDSAENLQSKLVENILPGTHIVSDSWAAYANIGEIYYGMYSHDMIGRKRSFMDSVDRQIHIQSARNMWMRARRKLRRQFGTSQALLPSYLREFVFRNYFRGENIFSQFLICLAETYTV